MQPIKEYISEALVGRSSRDISWTEKELKEQVGGVFLKWLGLDPAKHLSKVSVTGDKELHIDLTKPATAKIVRLHLKSLRPLNVHFKFTIAGSPDFPLELILDWSGAIAPKDSEYLNELFKDTYFSQISYGPGISRIEGLNLNMSFKDWPQKNAFDMIFCPGVEGYSHGKTNLPEIKDCNINIVFTTGYTHPYIGTIKGGSRFNINMDGKYKAKWDSDMKEIYIADDDLVLAAMEECASSVSPEKFGLIMNKDGYGLIEYNPDNRSKTLESLDKKFPCPWDKASWKDIKNVTMDIFPYSNPRLPKVSVFLSRDNSPAEIRVYMSEADYKVFHKES